MRIILADDHQLFLEGLRTLLALTPRYKVISQVNNTADLIESIEEDVPDLIIQDYRMPEGDAISTINHIKYHYPKIKLILLTGMQSSEIYKQILKTKADGILLKEMSGEDLLAAISQVMRGKRVLSPPVQNCLRSIDNEITTKEFQVLELVFEGLNSIEMAEKLNRSAKTVENHRYNLMQKLNVRNVAELMRYIHESGILDK